MNDNEQFADMPGHLFHGNLNLIELSMKNNKIYKLDAVQLPLDQLKKLSLADNPFVCNCSLIWLWQLIKSSSVTTSMAEGASGGEMNSGNNSNLLIIDGATIACDIVIKSDDANVRAIRKRLTDMSEADIKCPVSSLAFVLRLCRTGCVEFGCET